ncbi:hypothetical protein GcC1_220043 [Golovinomyces cichoracearum]|uniref:Uncharacterized protein n=1 Tax=Golovinomyces cichoracearum TaxID=62708 RepID=A0A420H7W0_9PEZI|nr:hypothetical protein GcC1_220043 [Golovinomyces cichoracearum]
MNIPQAIIKTLIRFRHRRQPPPPEITSHDCLTNNELAIVPKVSKRALRKGWIEANEDEIPNPLLGAKAGSSTYLDTANIIEGKRNRKKKLVQFLASQNPDKSYHVAFAASKGMVEPIGLHSSKLPKPPGNYKEMLRHEYSSGFMAAHLKEIDKLIEMGAI